MLTYAHTVEAPRREPSNGRPQPLESDNRLLDSIGSIEHEEHIFVLGWNGLDLMCALVRAGATQVTHLLSHERLEASSASLVIVPHVVSLDWLANALPSIRRALIPNGRLVVGVGAQPISRAQVRHMLSRHGLVMIRDGHATDRQVVSAEVPAFGLRQAVWKL